MHQKQGQIFRNERRNPWLDVDLDGYPTSGDSQYAMKWQWRARQVGIREHTPNRVQSRRGN